MSPGLLISKSIRHYCIRHKVKQEDLKKNSVVGSQDSECKLRVIAELESEHNSDQESRAPTSSAPTRISILYRSISKTLSKKNDLTQRPPII